MVNAQEELAFIRSMMQQTRRTAVDNGIWYIFWGFYIAAISLSLYVLKLLNVRIHGLYVWLPVISVGWLVTWLIVRRVQSRRGLQTLASLVLGGLWAGSGVTMCIIGFVGGGTQAIYGVTATICAVSGGTFYVSGILHDSNLLRWYCSLGWWSSAVLLYVFPGAHAMLVLALCMLLFQALPGIILYRRWKQDLAEPAPLATTNISRE